MPYEVAFSSFSSALADQYRALPPPPRREPAVGGHVMKRDAERLGRQRLAPVPRGTAKGRVRSRDRLPLMISHRREATTKVCDLSQPSDRIGAATTIDIVTIPRRRSDDERDELSVGRDS